MPKKRRRARIPTPAWERPRGTIGRNLLGRSGQFYGAVAVAMLIAVALGIIGYAFGNDYIEKQRRPGSTAIQVEDTKLRVDYFSNRLKMYVDQFGGQGSDAAQPTTALPALSALLIQEEIVLRFADELKVSATDDEIKNAIATRLSSKADDSSFDLVFRQEVARSQLSEDEYRRMVEASVLTDKLGIEFQKQVPKTAESAHYQQILVSSEEAAQAIRDELAKGGDFAALAKERSLDSTTKDQGGDVGWVPKGVLPPSMEELIFALDPKEITNIPVSQAVYIIEMLAKDDKHEVEASQKSNLAAGAFKDWVAEKQNSITVVNNMDLQDGDSKKIEWAVKRAYQS